VKESLVIYHSVPSSVDKKRWVTYCTMGPDDVAYPWM
jgi:hypothetical protein